MLTIRAGYRWRHYPVTQYLQPRPVLLQITWALPCNGLRLPLKMDACDTLTGTLMVTGKTSQQNSQSMDLRIPIFKLSSATMIRFMLFMQLIPATRRKQHCFYNQHLPQKTGKIPSVLAVGYLISMNAASWTIFTMSSAQIIFISPGSSLPK